MRGRGEGRESLEITETLGSVAVRELRSVLLSQLDRNKKSIYCLQVHRHIAPPSNDVVQSLNVHPCCRYNGVVQGLNVQLADAHNLQEEQEAREQSKVWTQVWILDRRCVSGTCVSRIGEECQECCLH